MDNAGLYLGQGLIIVLVGFLLKVTYGIKDEMHKLNGRQGKTEERVHGESRLSEDRHKTTDHRLNKLEE